MTGVNLDGGSYSDIVKYQLYQPTTSAGAITNNGPYTLKPWGSDEGTNTVDLAGKSLNDVIKVPAYADVPAGELDKAPDHYQDRVTISASY